MDNSRLNIYIFIFLKKKIYFNEVIIDLYLLYKCTMLILKKSSNVNYIFVINYLIIYFIESLMKTVLIKIIHQAQMILMIWIWSQSILT